MYPGCYSNAERHLQGEAIFQYLIAGLCCSEPNVTAVLFHLQPQLQPGPSFTGSGILCVPGYTLLQARCKPGASVRCNNWFDVTPSFSNEIHTPCLWTKPHGYPIMETTSSTSTPKSGILLFWPLIWLPVVPALKTGSSHWSVGGGCCREKETDGAIDLHDSWCTWLHFSLPKWHIQGD